MSVGTGRVSCPVLVSFHDSIRRLTERDAPGLTSRDLQGELAGTERVLVGLRHRPTCAPSRKSCRLAAPPGSGKWTR